MLNLAIAIAITAPALVAEMAAAPQAVAASLDCQHAALPAEVMI